ncbi:MAG: zinc-binding dehydrogenase [Pseudomonadales bacterium]|nr:zinc-binding dehydrogenase [Pseudomonadales bacterium]
MNKMQQAQIHGVNRVQLDTVEIPAPGPDDILVAVSVCGICGSDLGYIAAGGYAPPGKKHALGHEFSGRIMAKGDNVQHLELGQRVTVNPEANGQRIGNGGSGGAFAPCVLVRNVVQFPDTVFILPANMNDETGALVEPFSVAMHAVNQANIASADSVLIMGAGPIGLCTAAILKYRGIKNIALCDQSDYRLDIAKKMGATDTCNVEREELKAFLSNCHGSTDFMGSQLPATDVYFEMTGVGQGLEQAIALSAKGSRIIITGVHKSSIQFHPLFALMKELQIIGSMAYPNEFPEVIRMLASGKIDSDILISHRFAFEDFLTAIETAKDPDAAAKVLVRFPHQTLYKTDKG